MNFANDERTGKVKQTMNVDFALQDCPFENNTIHSSKPAADALLVFDILVLVITFVSLLFCVGWFCQGHKLRKVSKL